MSKRLLSSLSNEELHVMCAGYNATRAIRAAHTYYHYEILVDCPNYIILQAPPILGENGQVTRERYTLSHRTGKCTCGDQIRLDELNYLSFLRDDDIETVVCKHWGIAAILRARAQEQAEAEQAERVKRSEAVAVRSASWENPERKTEIAETTNGNISVSRLLNGRWIGTSFFHSMREADTYAAHWKRTGTDLF